MRTSRSTPSGHVRLPYLAFLNGPRAGEFVPLDGSIVTIGRAPECTISIPDRSVSRAHARMYRDGETYVLEDLQSRNGCAVGERTSPTHRLRSGDELWLGDVRARFELCDELEAGLRRRLYDAAMRDDLTGLLHRRPFEEHLMTAVMRARFVGGDVSLIVIDLDHFKRINDTYGHAAGDRVLTAVAHAANDALRSGDVLARIGGEELAVVLDGQPLAKASEIAERVRGAIARARVAISGEILHVTASFGIASMREVEIHDPSTMFALADQRLYLAKALGRDRVEPAYSGLTGQ